MSASDEDDDCDIILGKRLQLRTKLSEFKDGFSKDLVDEAEEYSSFRQIENEAKRKRRRISKSRPSLRDAQNVDPPSSEDDVVILPDDSPIPPPPPPKARKTRQTKRKNKGPDPEVLLQYLDNEAKLDVASDLVNDCEIVNVEESPVKEEILVKFKYQGVMQRIPLSRTEQLFYQMDAVADRFCITDPSSIVVTKDNKIVSLRETPVSLKLTVVDILDCILKERKSQDPVVEVGPDQIRLKFQEGNGRKETPTSVVINKEDRLMKAMEQYAQVKSVNLENIVFEFDGEKLSGSETPTELDIEDDCLVDVKFKK